jgi:hypothetical protein
MQLLSLPSLDKYLADERFALKWFLTMRLGRPIKQERPLGFMLDTIDRFIKWNPDRPIGRP